MGERLKTKSNSIIVYGPSPANHLELKFSFIKVNRPHQSKDKHLPWALFKLRPMDSVQLYQNTTYLPGNSSIFNY